jgi:3-phenylpropionate/trans-cinnamate dioxygenase ferredoxin component
MRNEPHGRGVETGSPFPPVNHDEPHEARGDRLVRLEALGDRGVVEVRTERHGVLAVGVAAGRPFAVSNVCRHQFAKLGRGRVTADGCLECPWHRARYDVEDGSMTSGPKGRVFGVKPYSAAVKAIGGRLRLATHPVEIRDSAIWLSA